MANVVQVEIVVDDKGSTTFRKASKEAEKAGKNIGESFQKAGKGLQGFGKNLSVGVTAPLVAVGAVSVKSALEADRLRTSLEGLAGGADQASSFITAIGDASLGTISDLDAMAISTKALSLGVVQTGDDMAALTETAIVLGRAQGLTAKQAVDDLTTALGRSSPMILDNLGITISAATANETFATSVGKNADALTDAEKKQAFFNEAMRVGQAVTADLGGVQEDAAAKAERFQATLANAQVTLGEGLIPVLEGALNAVTPLIEGFANMDKGTRDVVVQVGLFMVALGPAVGIIGGVTSSIGGLIVGLKGLNAARQAGTLMATLSASTAVMGGAVLVATAAIVGAGVAIKKFSDKVQDGNDSIDRTIEGWSEAVGLGADLDETMSDLAQRANDTSDAFENQGKFGNILVDIFVDQKSVMEDVAKETETIARRNAVVTGSYGAYIDAVNQFNSEITDSAARIDAVTQAQFDWQVSMTDTGNLLFDFIQTVSDSAEEMVIVDTAAGEMTISLVSLKSSLQSANDSWDDFVDSQRESFDALQEQKEAHLALSPVVDNLALKAIKAAAAENRQADAMARVSENTDRAAQVDQAFADVAASAAAGLRDQALAAGEAELAQIGLIDKLSGATEIMFKQQLLGAVDKEALGAEAYAQLGVDLGLLDESALALATGMGLLVDAVDNNIIPLANVSEVAGLFFDQATSGNPEFEKTLDKFARAPGLIGPSKDAMDAHHGIMSDMVDILPDATTGTGDFTTSMVDLSKEALDAAGKLSDLRQNTLDLEGPLTDASLDVADLSLKMDELANRPPVILDVIIKTIREDVGRGGGDLFDDPDIPEFAGGGIVPGPLGSPQLIIAHGGERVIPTVNNNLSITTSQPVNVPQEFAIMNAFAGV